jgi:hypothetical protein
MSYLPFTASLTDRLEAYQDRFFSATALGNNAAIESAIFPFGQYGNAIEAVISADSAITVASTKTLTIELLHGNTADGSGWSGTDTVTVKSYADGVIPAGEMVTYAPNTTIKNFVKFKITTTDNLTAKAVTGKLHFVA